MKFGFRLRCETPRDVAVGNDVRGARCLAKRLLCVAQQAPKPTQSGRRGARQPGASELSHGEPVNTARALP